MPLILGRSVKHVKSQNNLSLKFQVHTVSTGDGINAAAMTRSVLKKLISKHLARVLNWCGRGKKTGMQSMRLANVLKVTVRTKYDVRDASDLIIEQAAKAWLRNSVDQEGGRQERRKNKSNSSANSSTSTSQSNECD